MFGEEGVLEVIEIKIRIAIFFSLKGLVVKMCINDEFALIWFLKSEGHVELLVDGVGDKAGHDLDLKIRIRMKIYR